MKTRIRIKRVYIPDQRTPEWASRTKNGVPYVSSIAMARLCKETNGLGMQIRIEYNTGACRDAIV